MERTVLVVGDAAQPVEIANEVLAKFGFKKPESVATLAAAVTRLRNEPFDLVILSLENMGLVETTLIERDIRQTSSLIIGTARDANPDLILSALRAGIHEFTPSPINANEFAVSVDRLVRRMKTPASSAGTTIAVYSAKGGMGTTTVSVNIAASIAKLHTTRRVSLADYVVVGGDVRVLLDLNSAYDVGDLVTKVDRIDGELLFSLLTQGPGGIWILPSSDNPEVLELIDANTAATIVSQLRTHFGFVLVDTEHYLSERTLAALDAADRIVLLTQLSVPALRGTQRTLKLFERLGYPQGKAVIVVNRSDAQSALTSADAESVLGCPIYWALPNDFRACGEATNKGVPVVLSEPNSALSKSFMNLAAKLTGSSSSEARAKTNGHDSSSRLGRLLRLGRK